MNRENIVTKKLKPVLRFREFERDNLYKNYFFKDIFHFSTGKNIKQSEASPEFDIPCVRYGELYHMYNEVIYETINRTNLDSSELLFSKGDEILLPSAGEDPLDIGSASALTIENIAIGRTINILRPMEEGVYSQIYVAYYINQKLKRKIATLAKGSSISNVYNSDLKKLELYLPKLSEQQKVAQFLTSIDSRLKKLTQQQRLLEQYKKGLMQRLFSQEIRFRQAGGEVYEDWEHSTIGNHFEFKNGLNKEKEYFGKGTPIINFMDVYNLISIKKTQIKGLVTLNSTEINRFKAQRGDIFFTRTSETISDIGMAATLSEDIKDCVFSGFVLRARPKIKDLFNSHFLAYCFNSYSVRKEIVTKSSFTTRALTSGTILKGVKFSFPKNKEEQEKIADCLTAIDLKINQVKKQLQRTQTYKKGLLQQLFV